MDQHGTRAAAHWWWVKEDVGDGDSEIWCFERHVDGMLLRDESGGVARLEMFANDTTVSLFAEDHANDRSDPIIDLGGEEDYRAGVLPPHLQRCAGPSRYFRSLSIPHEARAEVLACAVDGVLVACPQWPPTVVALGDLRVHLARRFDQISEHFLVAAGVYWAILLVLAVIQARAVFSRRDICRRCS